MTREAHACWMTSGLASLAFPPGGLKAFGYHWKGGLPGNYEDGGLTAFVFHPMLATQFSQYGPDRVAPSSPWLHKFRREHAPAEAAGTPGLPSRGEPPNQLRRQECNRPDVVSVFPSRSHLCSHFKGLG